MRCGLPQTIKYAREQEESSSMLRDARWIESDPKTLIDWSAQVLAAAAAALAKGED